MIRTAPVALALAVWAGVPAAQAAEVTIPEGTYLQVKTEAPFDSNTANKGDNFRATVAHALWVDGRLAIPAGSRVTGRIKHVRAPKDGAKSAAMAIKFEDLHVGGKTYNIEGKLTSLKANERRRILDDQGKIGTGQHIDVVHIGHGTEAEMKADTLVGISGLDREDLADGWALGGLGPGLVRLLPGTELTMQFETAVPVEVQKGIRGPDDRSIATSADSVKHLQQALKDKKLYSGEVTGELNQRTRDAIARFQLDQNQPATGDADQATLQALGVQTTSR